MFWLLPSDCLVSSSTVGCSWPTPLQNKEEEISETKKLFSGLIDFFGSYMTWFHLATCFCFNQLSPFASTKSSPQCFEVPNKIVPRFESAHFSVGHSHSRWNFQIQQQRQPRFLLRTIDFKVLTRTWNSSERFLSLFMDGWMDVWILWGSLGLKLGSPLSFEKKLEEKKWKKKRVGGFKTTHPNTII